MLYSLYELGHLSVTPMRIAALMQSSVLRSPFNPMADTEIGRTAAAAADLFESVTRRYRKPDWNLPTTTVNAVEVAVTPKTAWSAPWCNMIHFERDAEALVAARGERTDPTVLIVAPMSGHYATLLRDTVNAFLGEHEVYVTDWADARTVPMLSGRFDLNDYIDYVMGMVRALGPETHVVAVCQPGPLVLAAVALMADEDDPCTPATMTIMGSPIDARKSPTAPNKLAETRDIEWFKKNMIHSVPAIYPGAFRRVYPGFLQLASFMGMNLSSHVDAHQAYFQNLVKGDGEPAEKHRNFYDEYLAVMDLSEEFYIQTLVEVFQEYTLANGTMMHRGRRVDPGAITKTALLTVEGENDDISGIGQTQAAHDICANIPENMRRDYIQPGVGHYGVFSGRRFRTEIYPRMREFMRSFQSAKSRTPKLRLKVVSE
ncbi:polyhydroxyalkanoate depolymerase [Terricaulis silvestris]|uniref:Polyhydroxyalkanoate depolymerase, intracellular n=1 Tax=Terricaulis silvestris TaxID=2686094 RepID=A0A6I6ML19_9CAUL|nr:polyhydroxyalkanoate depolymerase [Terricaulis silvestris]QGZ95389.1 polyhydroxyalkanoate depolymerase, intracellular [Terricaulis silvestris]